MDEPGRPTRQQYQLPTDKFIFANFNQLYKIDPHTFSVWMNVLKRVDNSVLWLLEYPADAKKNLQEEASKRGVNPDRIVFTAKAPKHEHINRCYLADLSLDNFVVNGHTTSTDLLWSGCPLLTMPATENMPSRVAASICNALGCPEMVCHSTTEFEDRAVELATSPQLLRALREKIDRNKHSAPLFDTQRWVRNLEKGLSRAWELFSTDQPRSHINVVD